MTNSEKLQRIQAAIRKGTALTLTRNRQQYAIVQVSGDHTALALHDPYGLRRRVALGLATEEIDELYSHTVTPAAVRHPREVS